MTGNKDDDRIVICKACGLKEYEGKMTWLNGRAYCRPCYRIEFLETYGRPYEWDDKQIPAEELRELGRGPIR